MKKFFNSFAQSIQRIPLSFTKESILAGFFFFLVLCSWYILRPVRNEMAVQNSEILPYLLGIGALVMLLLNPIYSWLASRKNLKGVLIGCYSFFISNLLGFIIFVPVTMIMARLGAKAVYKINKRLLSKIFGTFLIIVSIRAFIEYLSIN